MVMNGPELQRFEDELVRQSPVDIQANLRIMDAMYEEARLLGVFDRLDPLDGIEVDIRIARVVNTPLPADSAARR
jgi:hypothetical protein